MQYVMFTKHLQEWPLPQAAAKVKQMGFDGLDLTVRGQGFVLPENVEKDLAPALRVAADAGLTVPMLTTNITDIATDNSEALMATAGELGIKELKLGYHTYKQFGEYKAALENAKAKLAGIAAAAAKYGVRANLHIHSANFVTANPAVVAWLLADYDPAVLGAYIDPGHMTIEGGKDVWRQGMELLADRTNMMAVKSMAWFFEPDASRTGRWIDHMVPLSRGAVDWVKVWGILNQIGFDGVVSLHSEYQGSHSWRNLTIDEVVDQTREDFAWLRACREKALAS